MIVSINQPAYLPWLGYFHRIAASDVHVVLDHVQFEKNSFTNRNRIRTPEGSSWLTVPVLTKGRFGASISSIEVADDRWAAKHLATLEQYYRRTPFYKEHEAFMRETYDNRWQRLAPLNDHITAYLRGAFDIGTSTVRSSELAVGGTKSELVLNICRELGATVYLSGALGRGYLQEDEFAEAGIDVRYQDYRHPTYPQAFPGFEPNMAAIDLLLNCGPASAGILVEQQDAVA